MNVTVFPKPQPRVHHRPYMVLAWLQMADVFTTGLVLAYWSARAEGVWVFWWCQTKVRVASAVYGLVVANNVLFLSLWVLR